MTGGIGRSGSGRPGRRRMAVVVAASVAATLVSSCSLFGSEDADDEVGPGGALAAADVERAIEALASAGVAVRVGPGEPPLAATTTEGPVELLRFQARNLALEALHGGGTLGADLDAAADAAGGAPLTVLLRGWLEAAETPAAAAARQLLGDAIGESPSQVVVPGLVAALLLGDLYATQPGDDAGGEGLRAPAAGGPAQGGEGEFCADVARYVNGILEDLLDPDIELDPPWLADAIDRAAFVEPDDDELRRAAGALALLVYATSISRAWVPFLVASPAEVHYIVDGDDLTSPTKELRLAVDAGEGFIADEAAGCAELAAVQLDEGGLEGAPVGWIVGGLLAHTSRAQDDKPAGDPELDEDGHAVFGYQTLGESAEAHRSGRLVTDAVPVAAVVERSEIRDVEDAVRSVLTGGAGAAGGEVAATWARLSDRLRQLLLPRALTTVTVTHHVERPPEEEMTDPGGECGEGCAASNGDPHLVPVEGPSYDFQAAGEFTLLRHPDGDFEIQVRQEPAGPAVAVTSAVAVGVDGRRIGLYQVDAGVEVRVDGTVVAMTNPIDVGSARAVPAERGLELRFADGTVLWAVNQDAYGIHVLISPSPAVRTGGQGLLGPTDAGDAGLPRLPDGSSVAAPVDQQGWFDALYQTLRPAWQVDETSSLFDYLPGEEPATFVNEQFPSRPLTYDDLSPAQLEAGAAACAGVEPELVRRQCVFDVALLGEPDLAAAYATIAAVIAEALAGLGAPGPITRTVTAEPGESTNEPAPTSPPDTAASSPTTTAAPDTVGDASADGPALTLTGDLVASYSERAFDDGVSLELRGRVAAPAGSVLLVRTADCPPGSTVFLEVAGPGGTAFSMLCDPLELNAATADEDDEVVPGEAYVWLPAAADYDVLATTDGLQPTPMTIEVFADPTPTIVAADDLDDGDRTRLEGVGDVVVYVFDGTGTVEQRVASGFDEACALTAYGAPELGTDTPWTLSHCAHGELLPSVDTGGLFLPVIVFARTPDPITVEVTPG